MRRLLLVGAFLTSPLLASGCVVLEKRTRSVARASCHPSQYWDGNECRHKGKGHGARKHDGGGGPGNSGKSGKKR